MFNNDLSSPVATLLTCLFPMMHKKWRQHMRSGTFSKAIKMQLNSKTSQGLYKGPGNNFDLKNTILARFLFLFKKVKKYPQVKTDKVSAFSTITEPTKNLPELANFKNDFHYGNLIYNSCDNGIYKSPSCVVLKKLDKVQVFLSWSEALGGYCLAVSGAAAAPDSFFLFSLSHF